MLVLCLVATTGGWWMAANSKLSPDPDYVATGPASVFEVRRGALKVGYSWVQGFGFRALKVGTLWV